MSPRRVSPCARIRLFTGPSGFGAAAKDSVSFTYNAEASTEDRSWHAGCNSEVKLAHRAHGDRPAP